MDTTEAEAATEAEASTSASAATSEMEREAVDDVRPQHPWPYLAEFFSVLSDWTDYVANVVTNKLILTPLLYSRIIFDNNRIHL